MLALSDKVKDMAVSKIRAIYNSMNQFKAQGEKVFNLTFGEPSVLSPDLASQMAIEAIKRGDTRYTDREGIRPLRQRICDIINKENDTNYTYENVVVSTGARHSLYNAIYVLCNPDDEIIVPVPYWECYSEQVRLVGGKAVKINTQEQAGFKITPQQLEDSISSRTKAVILNSPLNPTGSVYTRDELVHLGEIAKKKDIYIISDEIYERIVYTDNFCSILTACPHMIDRIIYVSGLSKTYGMTGWRVGYTVSNNEISKAISNYQGKVTSNMTSISQYAALGALEYAECTALESYFEKRHYGHERICSIFDSEYKIPDGAFYFFPSVKKFIGKRYDGIEIIDAIKFCELLLQTKRVGIVPGEEFGMPGYVRISYAQGNLKDLKEAFDEIWDFVKDIY